MNMRVPVNTEPIVTRKYTLVYSLLFFCASLLSFVSSARAQPCTPVVYAFRHAEDVSGTAPQSDCFPGSAVKCSTALKPTGKEHANLYVEMITSFEHLKNYCPVATVYSVNPVLPNGSGGTNNPFYTGRPLANTVMNADPIITIDGNKLDEFLTQVTPQNLRTELVDQMTLGSVAVFWTSDGLHDLGNAIVEGFTGIPVKNKDAGVPPRNAVYVFEYDGHGAFTPPTNVAPYLDSTQYVQCFNWATFRAVGDVSSTKYYCGKPKPAGSISDSIGDVNLYKLHGRICDTCTSFSDTCPSPLKTVESTDYYGYCESPPSSQ